MENVLPQPRSLPSRNRSKGKGNNPAGDLDLPGRQVEKDMHRQGGDLDEKEKEIKDLVGGAGRGRQQLQRARYQTGERRARGPQGGSVVMT